MARKKVIDLETYNALDAWAISLHEMYKALRKAGVIDSLAVAIILEPLAYPEWILPHPMNPNHEIPTWDDDEDED